MPHLYEVETLVTKREVIRAKDLAEAEFRVRDILQRRNDNAGEIVVTLVSIKEQTPEDLPKLGEAV